MLAGALPATIAQKMQSLVLLLPRRALGRGGIGRDPALGQAGVRAEEELLHLLAQNAAGVRVGRVEPVVIDQDRHVWLPEGIGLGGDVVVDALAKLAGKGRFLQPRQLAADLHALHHSRHHCSPESRRGGSILPRVLVFLPGTVGERAERVNFSLFVFPAIVVRPCTWPCPYSCTCRERASWVLQDSDRDSNRARPLPWPVVHFSDAAPDGAARGRVPNLRGRPGATAGDTAGRDPTRRRLGGHPGRLGEFRRRGDRGNPKYRAAGGGRRLLPLAA